MAWGEFPNVTINGTTVEGSSMPLQIPGLSNIVEVACGSDHVLALDSNGDVWVWGDNSRYQLGDGTTVESGTPQLVPGLSGCIHIAADRDSSWCIRTDGTVKGWGNGELLGLGMGSDSTDWPVPTLLPGLSGIPTWLKQ